MVEYPKYKAPFDALTSVDERVDYIHDQIVSVQLGLNQLLEKEGIEPMALTTREVPLRVTLAPLQGTRITDVSPLTGKIVQIIPHWPAGCNALVDIAFGHGDSWVMPTKVDTFVALDNATPVLSVSEPVYKGEDLWMVARNGDAVNPHTVSVTVAIMGVE